MAVNVTQKDQTLNEIIDWYETVSSGRPETGERSSKAV